MKKRILFIINPISGTNRKRSIPTEIQKNLDTSRYDYDIRFTEHAGHAAEMAQEAAKNNTDIVVAVGGDGTINEVARSLVHSQTALGIIPCGSGNGLARHLQIPQNPKKAIEIINQGTVHCLDYGRINGIPFFCTCGMGFDAFVSQKFAESGRRGLLQYARNTFEVGIKYKSETYTIEYEDGTTETTEAFLIACANASQYGNNAYIAPTASMKDGLMDIIIMLPFPTIEGAHVLLQMFTKTLLSNTHVRQLQARRIRITRQGGAAVHCDGDPIVMGKEIEVELIQKSFNVVVNPEAHNKKRPYLQEMAERFEELITHATQQVTATFNPDNDPYNLKRFIEAQQTSYNIALHEIRKGKKNCHWMWYIFPQLSSLGHSPTAKKYGISGRKEAELYLAHPVLGARLQDITVELLHLNGRSALDIFGETDTMKLRSSMTLFSAISEEGNVFERVLYKYFGGQPCRETIEQIATSR